MTTNTQTPPWDDAALDVRNLKGPRWARWLYRVCTFIDTLGTSEIRPRKTER